MKDFLILGGAGLALCAAVPAQNPLNTFTNCGTTWATRGASASSNTNPAVLFVRHDMDHYAGFTSGATPGQREITGVNFVLQDQDLGTPDLFQLVVYTGDPALPSFPDVANPVATSASFQLPAGTGGGAWNASGNFATPVVAPATEDVYIGISFLSGWTIVSGGITDGLSVWEIRAVAPTTPQTGQSWDEPGGSIPLAAPDNTYGGYYVPSPLAGPAYPVQTQFKIQPIVPISGGVATALTNQVHHPESTASAAAGFTVQEPGAGTAAMFSALYPDAASPPIGAGRADDIGQLFENAQLPPGSLVFFMIDIGAFGLEIPAANFVPGSTGVSCLNLASLQSLGFGVINASGRAFNVTTFPAGTRSIMQGIDWLQQAIGLDVTTNTLHATACTRQRT